MEKLEYPCPCGGKVRWKKEKVIVEGVECGILDVELCSACGEQYFPEETMEIVQEKLKREGKKKICQKLYNSPVFMNFLCQKLFD